MWDLDASESTSKPMIESVVCRAELGLRVIGKCKGDSIDFCPSSSAEGRRERLVVDAESDRVSSLKDLGGGANQS